MSRALCPGCGCNLNAEKPIAAGRFSFSPIEGFTIDGVRMKMRPACHSMVGAVMAAKGAIVRVEALANRQLEESANPANTVAVYVHFLRQAFKDAGLDVPFERVRGIGLRWIGPPVERLAA